jgi:hypothetical protein
VTPERAKLADLIARLQAADTYAAQCRAAITRAPDVYDAAAARDAAEGKLAEAKLHEPAAQIAALIAGKEGKNHVGEAEIALAEADTQLSRARQTRDMLAAELAAAEKAVADRRSYLRESKGRALLAAPESAAWLAKRQRQRPSSPRRTRCAVSSPPPAACPSAGTSSAPLNETPCNPRPSLPGWPR